MDVKELKELKEFCVSCLKDNEETLAECMVSKKASELWDLNINDTYCWTCWDGIHYEYLDLTRDGDCLCELCDYNYRLMTGEEE